MFDGKYFDWNQKRIKGIVDHYGYKFFYGKKIADLGCGYADLSGTLYRLGAEITAVDARQDHLKVVSKKFPGVKVVRANLEGPWPFFGSKFDMVLDLGLICHLSSIEEHLKAVCSSTTYLVLETAVLDSEDPEKMVTIQEGKEVYDLAYNGSGCRPSAAYVEHILTNCGMSFKRFDNPKFNSGEYKYDWASQNDNSTSLFKRRIWFAVKNESGLMLPYVGAQPAVVVQPPSAPNFHFGSPNIPSTFVSNIQNTGVPTVLTASPRPPMHSRIVAEGLQHPGVPSFYTSNNYTEPTPDSLNFQVLRNSKEFALITTDVFEPPATFQNSGIILPNSPSSRLWMRKIAPFFPNISVSSKAIAMAEFKKSLDAPNVIMCSLDTLVSGDRVWVDEWFHGNLTQQHIDKLRSCKTILTPSLINAQEILKSIPEANVLRVDKPWPMLNVQAFKYDYFLYFEKDENITRLLLNLWEERFGTLIIVGTRVKLPTFAEFVSDTVSFTSISNLLMGAKAVIDISTNTYYMSGILKLAGALSLPIITNNQAFLNLIGSVMIAQNNSTYPAPENINKAINTFMNEIPKTQAKFNETYNASLVEAVQKLVGI
jgi:SAM-dependent methyltransferase